MKMIWCYSPEGELLKCEQSKMPKGYTLSDPNKKDEPKFVPPTHPKVEPKPPVEVPVSKDKESPKMEPQKSAESPKTEHKDDRK